MCDYSLHMQPNRLANEGETLVTHRFCGHTVGMASPAELDAAQTPAQKPAGNARWWSWAAVKTWLNPPVLEQKKIAAVCIPPGARLRINDIPNALQDELGVGKSEEVTFTQLSASEYVHRDGVRFSNGRVILLQRLSEGQRVEVLSLALLESNAADELRERMPATL